MTIVNSISLDKYAVLAELFYYPDAAFPDRVNYIQEYLDANYQEAAKELKEFTAFTKQATRNEMEELFTRSFEVQAASALDLGYLLFGDDYKRAKLMVNLNRELINAGIDCRNELSDHLPNVLKLLPTLKDRNLAIELITDIIYPSLEKIIEDFNPDKIKKKNKIYKKHHKTIIEVSKKYSLYYKKPVTALCWVFQDDFKQELLSEINTNNGYSKQTSDFLHSVETEMKIEKL